MENDEAAYKKPFYYNKVIKNQRPIIFFFCGNFILSFKQKLKFA